MKKNGLIRSVIDAIKDHNRDFSERMFLIFTIITEISVTVALIGDFFIGESKGEIITIVLTLTLVPILTVICLRRDKLKFAIRLISIGLVFLLIP